MGSSDSEYRDMRGMLGGPAGEPSQRPSELLPDPPDGVDGRVWIVQDTQVEFPTEPDGAESAPEAGPDDLGEPGGESGSGKTPVVREAGPVSVNRFALHRFSTHWEGTVDGEFRATVTKTFPTVESAIDWGRQVAPVVTVRILDDTATRWHEFSAGERQDDRELPSWPPADPTSFPATRE